MYNYIIYQMCLVVTLPWAPGLVYLSYSGILFAACCHLHPHQSHHCRTRWHQPQSLHLVSSLLTGSPLQHTTAWEKKEMFHLNFKLKKETSILQHAKWCQHYYISQVHFKLLITIKVTYILLRHKFFFTVF